MKTSGKLFLGMGLVVAAMLMIFNMSLAQDKMPQMKLVSIKADTAITLDAVTEKA